MHGIRPVQMLTLGTTSKTEAELNSWLRLNNVNYTQVSECYVRLSGLLEGYYTLSRLTSHFYHFSG